MEEQEAFCLNPYRLVVIFMYYFTLLFCFHLRSLVSIVVLVWLMHIFHIIIIGECYFQLHTVNFIATLFKLPDGFLSFFR